MKAYNMMAINGISSDGDLQGKPIHSFHVTSELFRSKDGGHICIPSITTMAAIHALQMECSVHYNC